MKNIIIIAFFVAIGNITYSQTNCDTSTIAKILNLQMKIADKQFSRKFVLSNSSTPFDSTKTYYQSNSTYKFYLCGRSMMWNKINISSKFSTLQTDTTKDLEYSCFVSTPMFNDNKTKCRLVMSTHFSEWGGNASYYFYKKRGRKWILERSTLIWIS